MTHHPHLHMIVPGGGLSPDGSRWIASRSNFLVHVNLLARLFSGKMLAMLTDAHAAGRLAFFNAHAGLVARVAEMEALAREFLESVETAARLYPENTPMTAGIIDAAARARDALAKGGAK